MDGLREPVGDQPPQVYWFRRALVLIAAVLLVGALWFIVAALTSGEDSDPEAPVPDTTTSTTSTAAPETVDLDDPSRPCTADDVTVTSVASPESVDVGSMPAFEVAVEHTGAAACSLSTTADGTSMTIRSGEDVYYQSGWCPDLPVFSDADWVLQPGDREALQATWTGQRYNDACEPGDNAPAGTFKAAIAVAGIPAEEATFRMVD